MSDVPIRITINDGNARQRINGLGDALSGLGGRAKSGASTINSALKSALASVTIMATNFKSAFTSAFSSVKSLSSSAASTIGSTLTAAFNTAMAAGLRFTSAMMGSFDRLKGAAGGVSNFIKNSFNKMGGGISEAKMQLSGFFTALAGGTAITLLADGMRRIALGSYEMSNAFFAAENALFAVTGSTEAAQESMGFVQNEAMRLGQDIVTLADSYAKLTAAGKKSALTQAEVRDLFSSVSETATVLSFNAQQTEGAFRALTQMLSKGKVQAEELRGQLGEHLPGAFEIAADAMGVTTAELDDMLKQGKITAEGLLRALPDQLREAYGKGLPDALQRSKVEFGRLRNEAKIFGKQMGDSMEPANKALAQLGRAFLKLLQTDEFQTVFENFSRSMNSWITSLANGILNAKGIFIAFYATVHKGWLSTTTFMNNQLIFLQSAFETTGIQLSASMAIATAGMKAVWSSAMNYFIEKWAGFLSILSKGADLVGADKIAASLKASANDLQSNITPAFDEFKNKIIEIRGEANKEIGRNYDNAESLIKANNAALAEQKESIDQVAMSLIGEGKSVDSLNDKIKDLTQTTEDNTDANKLTQDEIDAIMKKREKATKTLQDAATNAFTSTRTALETYNIELKDMTTLLEGGYISQDTFNRKMKEAGETMKETAKSLDISDIVESGFDGLSTALEDVFFDPTEENIKNIGPALLAEMRKTAAKLLADESIKALKNLFNLGDQPIGNPVTNSQEGAPNAAAGTAITGAMALMNSTDKELNPVNEAAETLKTAMSEGVVDATETTSEVLTNTFTWLTDGLGDFASNLGNNLSTVFGGLGDTVNELVGSLGNTLRDFITNLISTFASQAAADETSAIIGAVAGAASSAAAHGKVFSNGHNVAAFANGGVVNGPTNFPMAGGQVGLMGEAGPEAIMPLQRDAKGNLGVSGGGGGGTFTLNLGIEEGIIVKTMDSPAGGKVIVNQVSKNKTAIQGQLR